MSTNAVVCDKKDFAKRYKTAAPVKPPTEPGEAVAENDPDIGHDDQALPEAGRNAVALAPPPQRLASKNDVPGG